MFQNITFHQFYCFKAVCLLGKAFVDLTSIHDEKAEPGNCVKKICDFQKKSATCFADGHLKISKDSREVWSFVSFLACTNFKDKVKVDERCGNTRFF